jgi:ATP-dependent RNA helicase RhlE
LSSATNQIDSLKFKILSFEQLRLITPIHQALKDEAYHQPTAIQAKAIPYILEKKDLLGCAQTGTGKTAAFAIPILQLLHQQTVQSRVNTVRSLILTPTRELAIQIGESFEKYGKYTGLRFATVFGGVPQFQQVRALQRGVDILIATPGRLLDLISQRHVNISRIEIFVLDEADRMLDMGFERDVQKILRLLPEKKQTLFFSATMPASIRQLASSILQNPVKVEVTPDAPAAETVEQSVYFIEKQDKRSLLIHILKTHNLQKTIVFTRTKHGADKIAKWLHQSGIKADAIHGDKSQGHRQRVLSNFKSQRSHVLVATDIAARGIDIPDISHVINFEIPEDPETYVHRIGRTGRPGASGIALSFCDREEKMYLRDIHRLISKDIAVITDHPYPVTFSPTLAQPSANGGKKSTSRVFRSGNKSWRQQRIA